MKKPMKYTNWRVPKQVPVIPPALTAAGCTPLLAAVLHLREAVRARLSARAASGHQVVLQADLLFEALGSA